MQGLMLFCQMYMINLRKKNTSTRSPDYKMFCADRGHDLDKIISSEKHTNRVTVHTPTRRPTRRPTQHMRRDGRHDENVTVLKKIALPIALA